jgi:lysozyme
MKISPAGIELICRFESCQQTAYRDPVGLWTIGFGHTGHEVCEGLTITMEQARSLLALDLTETEAAVSAEVKVPLAQNQFDAAVSLAYNIGTGNFCGSTLLRLLNAGDYQAAADQFPRWCHAGNQVLPGLVARRAAERAMFLESA